jgi:hypothetical protein
MNGDDNDKLWELLGKARPSAVSPFFSRNVLRAVRQEKGAHLSFASRLGRFLRRWAWHPAFAGTCAVAILLTILPASLRHHHAAKVQTRLASQIVGNPDYEVINHLDELVADEESSLWLDNSTR